MEITRREKKYIGKSIVNSNQDCDVKDDVKEKTEKKIQHTIVADMINMRLKTGLKDYL